jgi:hypothetical protein
VEADEQECPIMAGKNHQDKDHAVVELARERFLDHITAKAPE